MQEYGATGRTMPEHLLGLLNAKPAMPCSVSGRLYPVPCRSVLSELTGAWASWAGPPGK